MSSAGAINGPALFLRSGLNNNGLVGTRTFLHPVIGISARFKEQINGFYGAPQSASSHHFIDRGNDKVGFFIEAAPTHPMLAATALSVFGTDQQLFMKNLAHSSFNCPACRWHFRRRQRRHCFIEIGWTNKHRLSDIRSIKRSFWPLIKLLASYLAAGAEQVSTLHPEPLVLKSSTELLFSLKQNIRWIGAGCTQHTKWEV